MNPQESDDFIAFVRRVRDEKDLTVLLIEHDMKVVMGVSRAHHRARVRLEDRRGHAGEEIRTTSALSRPTSARPRPHGAST